MSTDSLPMPHPAHPRYRVQHRHLLTVATAGLLALATPHASQAAENGYTFDAPTPYLDGLLPDGDGPPAVEHEYPGLPDHDPFDINPDLLRQQLDRAVREALAGAPELRDAEILVHVSSIGGVRLSGTVSDEVARTIAEIEAAQVQGVYSVDNRLRVQP